MLLREDDKLLYCEKEDKKLLYCEKDIFIIHENHI